MARDAAFWRWYAEVNDSIRHDVVERGWFKRETTQDIDAHDLPGMVSEQDEAMPDQDPFHVIDAHYEEASYEELYGPPMIEAPQEVPQIEQEQEID